MFNLCWACGHEITKVGQWWKCTYCGVVQSTPILQGGEISDIPKKVEDLSKKTPTY